MCVAADKVGVDGDKGRESEDAVGEYAFSWVETCRIPADLLEGSTKLVRREKGVLRRGETRKDWVRW